RKPPRPRCLAIMAIGFFTDVVQLLDALQADGRAFDLSWRPDFAYLVQWLEDRGYGATVPNLPIEAALAVVALYGSRAWPPDPEFVRQLVALWQNPAFWLPGATPAEHAC